MRPACARGSAQVACREQDARTAVSAACALGSTPAEAPWYGSRVLLLAGHQCPSQPHAPAHCDRMQKCGDALGVRAPAALTHSWRRLPSSASTKPQSHHDAQSTATWSKQSGCLNLRLSTN